MGQTRDKDNLGPSGNHERVLFKPRSGNLCGIRALKDRIAKQDAPNINVLMLSS